VKPLHPFAWVGLATTDPARAATFYMRLLGWQIAEFTTQLGAAGIFKLAGADVALVYSQTREARAAKIAPHWTAFIAVDDADAGAAEAEHHGASVLRRPFDVAGDGRVATLQDPLGTIVSLWHPGRRAGATLVNAVNAHCLTELVTADLGRARSFYGGLFGWRFDNESTERITVVGLPGPRIRLRAPAVGGLAPEGWLPYFMVEQPAAIATKAEALGGTHLREEPARDSALVVDPTGATFGVIAG
jgi:predicted enzyme related to lactoylglutathione lyase